MPRRLAITGPYVVEVLTYTDPALEPNQVLVKTEIASSKHGTTTGMFDGSVFRGQRFDQQMRLFIPKEPEAEKAPAQPRKPENTGTIGGGGHAGRRAGQALEEGRPRVRLDGRAGDQRLRGGPPLRAGRHRSGAGAVHGARLRVAALHSGIQRALR